MSSDNEDDPAEITAVLVGPASASSGLQPPPAFCRAELTIVSGPGEGTVYRLREAITVIGRDEGATIQLGDPGLSRKHCVVTYESNEFRVADMDSANGTFLNGSRVKEYAIRNGDKLLVGDTLLQFAVAVESAV